MNIIPLQDYIIVRKFKDSGLTKSGIYTAPEGQQEVLKGEVLAVGPGKTVIDGSVLPMDVSVGDTVMFGRYGTTEITHDEQTYLAMSVASVIAIIPRVPSLTLAS